MIAIMPPHLQPPPPGESLVHEVAINIEDLDLDSFVMGGRLSIYMHMVIIIFVIVK